MCTKEGRRGSLCCFAESFCRLHALAGPVVQGVDLDNNRFLILQVGGRCQG